MMSTSLIPATAEAADLNSSLLHLAGSPCRHFSRAEGQAVRVSVYGSWEQLKKQVLSWEAILANNRALSIFSTPEWLGSWWKAFGANKQMLGLGFSTEDNSLVGLALFYFDEVKNPLFGKLAFLRLVGDGSGDSDNLDLIIQSGFEKACAQALVRWLGNQRDWDVCFLNTLPEHSLAATALKHDLERARWTCVLERSPNSAISLPASWPQYVDSVSPRFRPLVTRYPQRLVQRYQVRIYRCEHLDDLSRSLRILFSLHAKRWNSVNQPGSFGSSERRKFYFEMAKCFLNKGWLELWLLELNGVPAAAQYCFRYSDTVCVLQEGFDPGFASDKAGYALRAAALRHFIETGVKKYDFLGGLDPHKQNWGAKPGSYLNLQFARPGSLGSLYLRYTNAMTRSKEWLRGNLPAPAWNILHWIKLHLAEAESSSV